MDTNLDFTTVLRTFMQQAHRTPIDLARLTGIALDTLGNWTSGKVRRPRVVTDVLKLARALALDAADTTTLLTAAGHPPLATLHAQAQQTGDSALSALLDAWPVISAPAPATAAAPPAAPPPRAPCHQLRAPVADFVGRAREIEQLLTALRVALVEERGAIISGVQGMGGVGKTELAYFIAHQLREAFPDAQIVLNLRGSSATPLTPEQTLQAIIHALTPETKLPDELPALEQHYRTLLHNSRILILADDARDAVQVQGLLPPAGSAVLITSRQRFILPGMISVDLEQLSTDEAVMLLRTICPRLDAAEAQLIARACGYLPLALRISGSILHSTPALAVATYLARLGDERQRLRALRDPDDPQLDVEASLALSYAQLDAAAQQVFRQLGVFAADFASNLASAVVVAPGGGEIEAMLHLLLRRNLVLYDAEQGRWRLHDLVRDLARTLLQAAGEAEAAWWRYARAAVQIAAETQEQYEAGRDGMLAALARFDAERAHIDAGRRWAAEQAGTEKGDQLLVDDAMATRYIGMLRYDARRERIPQCERALATARRLGDQRAEGWVLNELGLAYALLGEAGRAIPYYEQALGIARTLGDRRGEAQVLNNLGNAYIQLGEAGRAIPYYEQVLSIARALDDQHGEGEALNNLGNAYIQLGDIQRAIPYLEQGLASFRTIGARRGEAIAVGNLGDAYIQLGEAGRAIPYHEQALTIFRALGDRHYEGWILINLGNVYAELGVGRRALPAYEQALTIFRALGNQRDEGWALGNLGNAYTDLGEAHRAIEPCGVAVTLTRELGDRRQEGYALSYLARAQARQGDFAGATTTFEQALTILHEIGDRHGEAECNWQFGLALAQQGECERALLLLRAAVTYEQEIGHTKAAERAALLARLEAGEELPAERQDPVSQRVVGADTDAPPDAAQP